MLRGMIFFAAEEAVNRNEEEPRGKYPAAHALRLARFLVFRAPSALKQIKRGNSRNITGRNFALILASRTV